MKLLVTGTTPSKKNSRINTRSGRSFPSAIFSAWEKTALPELTKQFDGLKITQYPVTVTMIFYNPDNRRHDLDNQASSILDTLVKSGILEDDNQNKVDCIQLQYGGVDKENPRCEIFIDD